MKFIGIDNGVSGSIAIIQSEGNIVFYGPTPVFRQLNYTKKKAWINRINVKELDGLFDSYLSYPLDVYKECLCAIERPMINPGRFRATISAVGALEATQIVLEDLKIPYEFIDSKEWQRELLPKGLQKEELKAASNSICNRLFPGVILKNPGDGDSLLIAEYLRRKYTK